MPMGGDAIEGPVSSLILSTVGAKQNEDTVSQEDLAWADSCLIKDPDISGTNWDSLTEALLDVSSYQTDSIGLTPAKRDISSWGTDMQILHSSQEAGTSRDTERTAQINEEEEVEKKGDEFLTEEKNVNLGQRSEVENVFRPTYKGEMRGIEISDSDSDLSFLAFGIEEESIEDIFKVWDLEIPDDDEDEVDDDDDEFIKQLKKALLQSSLPPIPYTCDDSGVWKGLKDESLDDLVNGIEGLSLSKKSG
ncbi:hypothetical protein LguiA_009019 [Lonicera macranthoides]